MCNFGVFFKKTFFIATACIILIFNVSASFPTVSASSAILINADTLEVIYSKDAYSKRGMASTTKIMTAILAIENGDLERNVKISDKAIGVEGSSLYLTQGEEMTMRELLYGLMLRSANDAAEAIAIEISGGVNEFSCLMNRKAMELGLSDTNFTNPHGLSCDEHFTTAFDLAKLTAYAMKNDVFKEICSSKKATISGNRTVVNHNKLLFTLDGVCGVKTGYTKDAGRCLVSAASKDGVNLIAVTLNAPNDWQDHKTMLDFGFSEYELVTLASEGDVFFSLPILGGEKPTVSLVADKKIEVCLRKRRGSIVESLKIIRPRFSPVYKGEILGFVEYCLDGKIIATAPLVSTEYVGTIGM